MVHNPKTNKNWKKELEAVDHMNSRISENVKFYSHR